MTKNTVNGSNPIKENLLQYAAKQYGTKPECLWLSKPNYAVLRHNDNRKWYAVLMDVPREKLGLSGEDPIDILDVKCDPLLAGSLRMEAGILPAYHMNRDNWITVLLDGTVDPDRLQFLLDQSYTLTASRREKARQQGPCSWLIPANPALYDVEQDFRATGTILWKQRSHIQVGDTVYLYMAAPVSAICYQCEAVEVDIPRSPHDGAGSSPYLMRLGLQHRFREGQLSLKVLKEYGVTTVRGPRYVPEPLRQRIEKARSEP